MQFVSHQCQRSRVAPDRDGEGESCPPSAFFSLLDAPWGISSFPSTALALCAPSEQDSSSNPSQC